MELMKSPGQRDALGRAGGIGAFGEGRFVELAKKGLSGRRQMFFKSAPGR